MLGAFKAFIKMLFVPGLYGGWLLTLILTVVKEASWGLYLIVFLIPQPNVWYKFFDYPLGNNTIDFLFLSVLIGIAVQKKGFTITSSAPFILAIVGFSYFALWESSFNFSLPMPITTANALFVDWKNYAQMILLYFLALNVLKEEDRQKKVIVLMSIVIFFIAFRSYRNFEGGDTFRYDKRVGGPFEAVGLGANHLGAFIADYCSMFLGLFLFDKNKRRRLLFLATVLFGLHPLFFSYSRGAYLAVLAVIIIFGLLKKRSMLVVAALILFTWQTLLPVSVVDRIKMTKGEDGEIEHSAGGRLLLWDLAINLFKDNPITGVGYGGYSMSVRGVSIEDNEVLPENQDVHNFYMRTLCEQGIIGMTILISALLMALRSGWKLYRAADTPFYKGLGFGFIGVTFALIITNMFGDRWTYFVLGGYFWIFWGIVDRSILNHAQRQLSTAAVAEPVPADLRLQAEKN